MTKTLEALTFGESDLSMVARKLANHLQSRPFTLWLQGDIGAGKTTLTRAILHALGLSQDTPVQSPTYTIMNEIKIGERWYAHLDLYRLPHGSDLTGLGLFEHREYAGIFVEWPRAVADSATIQATHMLTIEVVDDNLRRIQLAEY